MGFYKITIKSTINNETIESSLLSTSSSECYTIDSDSSCTFSFRLGAFPMERIGILVRSLWLPPQALHKDQVRAEGVAEINKDYFVSVSYKLYA